MRIQIYDIRKTIESMSELRRMKGEENRNNNRESVWRNVLENVCEG